ncbi:twin-arginine translocation signal domain-containing protein [Kitasatospora sp. NPDC059571]|uniref:twin-arginine translocation signal domain-containing protein n=1 Tax=Kitasatospora sp. NPDC059571 TaxID=3346871 RepID=UPI00369A3ECE
MSLSRRGFLGVGAAGSAALLFGNVGPAWRAAADSSSVPAIGGPLSGQSTSGLYNDLQTMVSFGPRLTGSPAHAAYINWLEQGLTAAGLTVQRTSQSFTRWQAGTTGLQINSGPSTGAVNVGAPYPYCGSTPGNGVTGPLVYVNQGSPQDLANVNLQGAIAVFDVGPFTEISVGDFDPLKVSRWDPDGTLSPDEPITMAFYPDTPFPLLDAVQQAGAIGAIVMIDAAPAYVANQWTPFDIPMQGIPAVMLDRVASDVVRPQSQAGGVSATLTMTAQLIPSSTDMLVSVIPGASDEIVVLNTHTDGQNAIEENGTVVLLGIARALAQIPQRKRPRTYVIVFATAHFLTKSYADAPIGAGLKSTQLFIDTRPDLMARTVASFCIEHIGPRQWVQSGNDYVATGLTEPHFHITSPVASLQNLCASASKFADFRRSEVLNPFPGHGPNGNLVAEGDWMYQAGVPTIQTVSGPHRLLQIDQGSVLDTEIDPIQWQRGVNFCFAVAGGLSLIPTSQL